MCLCTKLKEGTEIPRGDKTGPQGQGSKTGRVAGYCAGYTVPGYMNPIRGYGRGLCRGRGRGFGRGFGRGYRRYLMIEQPTSSKNEIDDLKRYEKDLESDKNFLEQEIGHVRTRIEQLKTNRKTNLDEVDST